MVAVKFVRVGVYVDQADAVEFSSSRLSRTCVFSSAAVRVSPAIQVRGLVHAIGVVS
jgi:hypothetical protein